MRTKQNMSYAPVFNDKYDIAYGILKFNNSKLIGPANLPGLQLHVTANFVIHFSHMRRT